MQKFQNMYHSNSRTFKDLLCFPGLSRAWNFFPKFKDFSRTLWTLTLQRTHIK